MKSIANLFIGFSIMLCATNSFSKDNIFEEVAKAKAKLNQNKYFIVYTYATWCGGVQMDLDSIFPILSKYRDKFNLILITDSLTISKASKQITALKPDGYVYYNGFFKKGLQSKKEMKKMGREFNAIYTNAQPTYAMGPGAIYLTSCKDSLIRNYILMNRANTMESDLKSIPETCAH